MHHVLNTYLNRKTYLFLLLASLFSINTSAKVGTIVPDFQLPYFEKLEHPEGQFQLSQEAGQILILEWFGWWCPFCPPFAQELDKQVVRFFNGKNQNNIPVKHISLHVEGPDDDEILKFAQAYHFQTVLMDVNREAFKKLGLEGNQPFLIVLNAVENAEGIQQWQILYEVDGYGGGAFPAAAIKSAINSVKTTTSGTGGNAGVAPSTPPTAQTQIPFEELPLTNSLKDTDAKASKIKGLGWIWDQNFPNIYSFNLANDQKSLPKEKDPQKGWIYINPNQTHIANGLLAFVYATNNWIWIPQTENRRYMTLSERNTGISGWNFFSDTTTRPLVSETAETLAKLKSPLIPTDIIKQNPFSNLPLVETKRNTTTSDYSILGNVNDTQFPILKSDSINSRNKQQGGYFFIQNEINNEKGGLFAYLYDHKEWVWIPKNNHYIFHFDDLKKGENGWTYVKQETLKEPSDTELTQFQNSAKPTDQPIKLTERPFQELQAVMGIKDTSKSANTNIGWIDDSRYPYVYAFNLNLITEFTNKTSETESLLGGWLYFNEATSGVANGYWAYQYQTNTWLWLPKNQNKQVLVAGTESPDIGRWTHLKQNPTIPNQTQRNSVTNLKTPDLVPSFETSNTFANIEQSNNLKNSETSPSLIQGLGWINDQSFPFIYSYDLARKQVIEETKDGVKTQSPKAQAGWLYVEAKWSNIESGLLIYVYAEKEWRWYPANAKGWYFNLTHPNIGNSGWINYQISQ